MTPENAKRPWNPYLAGALAGLLIIASVWLAGKYLGASTTFVRSAGMIEKTFAAQRVSRMPYFIKELPRIDWQFTFVLGILGGALLAALHGGTFRWQAVPDMWQQRFGSGRTGRWLAAFGGGVVAMFGARLAGG